MKVNSKFLRHTLEALASIAVAGVTLFYGLLHLGLGIPSKDLRTPFVLFVALQLVFVLVASTLNLIERLRRGDSLLFLTAFGTYLMIGWVGIVYFASKLGFLDHKDALDYYIVGGVTISLVLPLSDWIWRKRHAMRSSGRNR